MRPLLVALSLLLLSVAEGAAAPDDVVSRWVQLAPGGGAELRAVTHNAVCPTATVDGAAVPMQLRAAPDDKFPIRLCAVALAAGVKTLALAGHDIAVPKAVPQRILVLGDTGCRIKGGVVQACNDPAAWPFPQVAAQAAKLKPDLVIHVGDYLYRETACPPSDAGCAGSPIGDAWPTWAADFFTPAAPLLAAAPWVIVRGNHEDCTRAGAGFLRLLGPLPHVPGAPCADHVAPYAVGLGGVNLVVMDNASAPDRFASDALVKTYTADFAALPRLSTKPTWLAMHHPVWGILSLGFGVSTGGNTTLMSAVDAQGIPSAVELMLAGHIHTFEAIDYDHGMPPQLIVGEGGDILDPAPADLTGLSVGREKITSGLSLPGYGFLLMTRQAAGWHVDVFDASGARERSCTVAERRVDCPGAAPTRP